MTGFHLFALFVILIRVSNGLVIESFQELLFDSRNRLETNYLLYSGEAWCKSGINRFQLPVREALEMSAGLSSQYFGNINASEGCVAVCLQKGTHVEHALHPLPKFMGTGLSSVSEFAHDNCQQTEVGFLSYATNVATIYWLNGFKRVEVGTLKHGERHTVWQTSYLGHRFVVEDSVTKEKLLEVTVTHDAVYPIGENPSAIQPRDVSRGVKETFKMEWTRSHRVIRTFTPFGFNKGKLPLDLWGSISAYYHNNRNHMSREEWNSKGLYVNWWERDVFFIPMPWELKRVWQMRIKKLVEDWVGIDLEITDIYGMRRYEDGARLLTHVDREATHAASVIMNIDQGDIRTPWKVEIYDFADRLHEIEMEPGDIVYYESARCLHGRMAPLDGGYYVNLFSHYRPIGDPEWFLKPNPPGTPAQAIDIGQCTSDGKKASCNGKHPVPYLSPSLDTLRGPEDLYNFWVETGRRMPPAPAQRRDEL